MRAQPIGVTLVSYLFFIAAAFQLFVVVATAANLVDWIAIHWLLYTLLVIVICGNTGVGIGLLYLMGLAREWAIFLAVIQILTAIFLFLLPPSSWEVSSWLVAGLIVEALLFGATAVYLVVSDRFFVYS
jgi:hypothetical protein